MRFLLLIAAEDAAGADHRAMARYQRELVAAGVLLAGEATSGFWLLEVDSPEEAVEWGRRVPHDTVEIREVADWR